MISRSLFPNPVLKSMTYNNGILRIEFRKKGQLRLYECSQELAYRLFYQKNAADELAFYSREIKKKCNVADVLNPK